MSSTIQPLSSPIPHELHSCCNTSSDMPPQWFHVIERITALALATFAYKIAGDLFLPFFLAGIVVAGYQLLTSATNEQDTGAQMGCSRGLMEQLTGVKLHRLVSLATDVAILWCHIEHHAFVFVPVVALYSGAKTVMSLNSLKNAFA